jgi:hypothetical protein
VALFTQQAWKSMKARFSAVYIALALAFIAVAAAPLSAQEAKPDTVQDARSDSLKVLEARIKKLEARLDSLLAALARGEGADSAARGAASELEALRAAAQAAAGEADQDTTASKGSRTRDLSVLNPEISVTGDILGLYVAPAGEDNYFTAVPREFEFSFQAPVDPYTLTKIFVSYEEEFPIAGFPEEEGAEEAHGGFEIEEGYIYWVRLPVSIKAGKFRQQIGLYNRWHTHALLEVDRPLASVALLGDDGLIETGASFGLPVLSLGPSTNMATLELTRGSNEALFDGSKQLSFLGTIQSFWDLSASSYIQFSASGVYGENDEESLNTGLLEFDVSYRWRPPGRGLYRDLRLAAEWYFARKDFGDPDLTGNGGFLQANYRIDRRLLAGVRGDYLNPYGDGPDFYQIVPTLTWWQSEWVYLRLQYNYLKPEGGSDNHTVILQVVWAIGPHRHETY